MQAVAIYIAAGDTGRDLMMAAILGKIDHFNPEQEEWPQYAEHLVQFFEANDSTGDGKATRWCVTSLQSLDQGPTSCYVASYPQQSQRTRHTMSLSRN